MNKYFFQAHSSTFVIAGQTARIWSPMSILLVEAESKETAIQMVDKRFGVNSYILCMTEEELASTLSYYNFADMLQAFPGGEVNIIEFS